MNRRRILSSMWRFDQRGMVNDEQDTCRFGLGILPSGQTACFLTLEKGDSNLSCCRLLDLSRLKW